jgi:hypothetical protein
MPQFMLLCNPTRTTDRCAICGKPATASACTQLVLADSQEPVCQDCGRRHAPPLAALVRLASEAERVGRIGRHGVFPPYTALLALARAADNYTAAMPRPLRQAG